MARSSSSPRTHRFLTGFPDATIYELGDGGLERIAYEDTDQYRLTQSFLEAPERFLRRLLEG